MNIADVTVGTQYGDEAKGKVTHYLAKHGDYTHVLRWSGGCNAGHTIFHNGQKFVTHHIPAGVFFGIKSIIGPGCVVNVKYFLDEVKELQDAGIQIHGKLFIAENAHVITDKHGNPKKRWTSGWGHSPADGSVEPEGWVSVEQANKDLREDIKGKALKRIRNNVKINDFDKFSPSLKQDIVASYFRGGLSGSPDTREHINAKKYDEAAREFLRHNEYEDQVTGDGKKPGIVPRMNRLSRALINEGKVFKEYEKAFNKPKNKKKKKQ